MEKKKSGMRKQTIQLIVLVVLLLGALAAFLLLRSGDSDEDIVDPQFSAVAEDTVYVLGGAETQFAKSVSVLNSQDSYTLENGFDSAEDYLSSAESEHTVAGIDLAYLNQATLRSVFTGVGSLPAKRVVAESGANFADYGLVSPSATVTVKYPDTSVTLLLGDDAPSGEGIYAAVGSAVYVLDASKVSMFREPRFYFVGRTITDGNSESTIPLKLTLTGGKFDEPVVIEKLPDDEMTSMTGFSSYRIVSPIEAGADSQKGVTQLQTLFGLAATAVLADTSGDPAALGRYGLETPYMTVDAQAEEISPFTLAFSQPDSDGNISVKSSASPFVYQVSTASLPFLELTLFDLQEKMIVLPHIDKVSEVEVTVEDMVYLFELSGEGDELVVGHGGSALTAKNFRQFYQTLIAASYDSEIGANESAEQAGEIAGGQSIDELKKLIEDFAQSGGSSAASSDIPPKDQSASAEPPEGVQVEDPSLLIPEEALPAEEESSLPDAATESGESEAAPAEGGVLLQITYRYRDGSASDTVLFEPGPARKAIVSLNGGKKYYARSVYVDRVREDLPEVAADQEVKSFL